MERNTAENEDTPEIASVQINRHFAIQKDRNMNLANINTHRDKATAVQLKNMLALRTFWFDFEVVMPSDLLLLHSVSLSNA